MKKTIKNILLIIWILISLKIIWLTGGFVFKVLGAFVLKALNIPDFIAYEYIWKYLPAKPINEDDFGAVSLIVAYLNVLLFVFVSSTWVLYFLYKKTLNVIKLKKQEYIGLAVLLIAYSWNLFDIIPIVYNEENILNEIKNTNLLLLLQILITLTLIINTNSVLIIFRNNVWSIYKKFLFSFIILATGLIACMFIAFVIIWNQGALALALQNPTFELRTIEEIIHALYNLYGINISWCNPAKIQPCAELQESMRQACASREFTSQMPIGGKRLRTNIIGQMIPVIADVKDGCSELRGMFDGCMQEQMRGEFVQRWKNFNSITAEAKPKFEPIDTWSKYIKK